MKKTLLAFALVLTCHVLLGQTPTTVQCNLTIHQIQEAQTFETDHPKQIEVLEIAEGLFAELTTVYDLVNQDDTTGVSSHIDTIDSLIESAKLLGMNYSMFQADLDFIETLN